MNTIIYNGILTASINTAGAELNSLQRNGKEYLWSGNPEFWGKHSPVLFPIVGTLKNNTYKYNGIEYNLSRHGFARDNVFSITEQSEESITFRLGSDDSTSKVYPFRFSLEIKYSLKDTTLFIDYRVINNGIEPMPFSLGAHPAFALYSDFESYSLEFDDNDALTSYRLKNDLLSEETITIPLTEKSLPLNYELFANDALVIKGVKSKSVTIREKESPVLRLNFQDFPDLGLWTKPGAPFICIEPWHGYSDTPDNDGTIINKEGIIVLVSGNEFTTGFSIDVL